MGTIDFNYWIDATSIQGWPIFEGGVYFFVHVAENDGNSECCKRPPHIQVCMDSCKWQRVMSYQRTVTIKTQCDLELSA